MLYIYIYLVIYIKPQKILMPVIYLKPQKILMPYPTSLLLPLLQVLH